LPADVHLRRFQLVQNAAARLVSVARRHDHITPILATLHRLPVRQRVIFKTAVPVWECLHDAAPRYLADLCAGGVYGRTSQFQGPSWCPGLGRLLAGAAFAPYGLRIWNQLLTDLRSPELLLASFKRQLKTHLFQH